MVLLGEHKEFFHEAIASKRSSVAQTPFALLGAANSGVSNAQQNVLPCFYK